MEADTRKLSKATGKADHLCVLVHGLWGNPTHLNYIASALRDKYEDQLIVLTTKRNSGSFTYDGIELGGERVAKEIEETLVSLSRDGHQIKKLSMVGYSLGGLIARYAIGLLHSKGWFDKLKPVNFTTFATPHLGVRTPLKGYNNHLWNVLGARTLSMSGRQLFGIDSFRETGRPLLSVLADPNSIFIRALARFENRCVYANIVNDRSATYYTTAISKKDPFSELDHVDIQYLKEYAPVVLDPDAPLKAKQPGSPRSASHLEPRSLFLLRKLNLNVLLILLVPFGIVIFLINSLIQTVRSRRRIRLHETASEDEGYSAYRVPYIIRDARQAVEDVFENINAAHSQEYIKEGSEEMARTMTEANARSTESLPVFLEDQSIDEVLKDTPSGEQKTDDMAEDREQADEYPTLALAPAQFAMIQSLDDIGFRKYPVYIHKDRHSHAAMIVRMPKATFEEGKVVVNHWLKEEFKM